MGLFATLDCAVAEVDLPSGFDLRHGPDFGAVAWIRGVGAMSPGRADQYLGNVQVRLHAEGGEGSFERPGWTVHVEASQWRSSRHQDWEWLEANRVERRWQGPGTRIRGRNATTLDADWAYLRGRRGGWEYTVGRQPISRGIGKLWSVLDLHSPFLPTDVERLYKPGVDAMLLEGRLTDNLSSVSLVSLRREPGEAGVSTHWQQGIGWQDQWGQFQAWVARRGGVGLLGLGLQRLDWFGGDWYAEVLWHHGGRNGAEDKAGGWRGLLGLQYRLSPKLVLGAEVLHQSKPVASGLPVLGEGRNYAALALNWEVHPLVQIDAITLRNLGDDSAQGLVSARWQARSSVEYRATISVPLGGAATTEYRRLGRAVQLSVLFHY